MPRWWRRLALALVAALAARCTTASRVTEGPAIARLAHNDLLDRTAPEDRDGDGVDDAHDLCPEIPEDHNGDRDDDGCPEAAPNNAPSATPSNLRVLEGLDPNNDEAGPLDLPWIVALEREPPVHFAPRSRSPDQAEALLDRIARRVAGTLPERRFVLAGAATRDEGRPDTLALVRAQSVAAALVRRGVSPERLLTRRLDPRCPSAFSRTVRIFLWSRAAPWRCGARDQDGTEGP